MLWRIELSQGGEIYIFNYSLHKILCYDKIYEKIGGFLCPAERKKISELDELEYQKYWESLTISNDFIFSKIMRDEEICKDVIEVLMDLKISKIKYIEEQKVIDINHDGKSIRLDVFVEDSDRVFNVEIQTSSSTELPKRTRYYQGMIDLNFLEKGLSYKKLKESYVIFICTFDLFNKGLPIYIFENICQQDNTLKLDDKAYKVFFNAKSYSNAHNENLKLFLKYVMGETEDISENDISSNKFIKKLDNKLMEVKINREWRREFMTLLIREQEIAEENFKKGIEQGIEQGGVAEKLKIAKKMLLRLTDLDISEMTGLPLYEVEKLREEYK